MKTKLLLMEVETKEPEVDKELAVLHSCNETITKINQHLSTTLANLDSLSASINRYHLQF